MSGWIYTRPSNGRENSRAKSRSVSFLPVPMIGWAFSGRTSGSNTSPHKFIALKIYEQFKEFCLITLCFTWKFSLIQSSSWLGIDQVTVSPYNLRLLSSHNTIFLEPARWEKCGHQLRVKLLIIGLASSITFHVILCDHLDGLVWRNEFPRFDLHCTWGIGC